MQQVPHCLVWCIVQTTISLWRSIAKRVHTWIWITAYICPQISVLSWGIVTHLHPWNLPEMVQDLHLCTVYLRTSNEARTNSEPESSQSHRFTTWHFDLCMACPSWEVQGTVFVWGSVTGSSHEGQQISERQPLIEWSGWWMVSSMMYGRCFPTTGLCGLSLVRFPMLPWHPDPLSGCKYDPWCHTPDADGWASLSAGIEVSLSYACFSQRYTLCFSSLKNKCRSVK